MEFLEVLTRYASVKPASSDESLFVLTDKRVAALDQSLSELNLVDMDRWAWAYGLATGLKSKWLYSECPIIV